MARPKSPNPTYRFHLSGQAVVEIEGISFYLGQHGSHESYARYTALLRIYQENNLSLPEGFSPKVFRDIYEATQATGGQLTAVNISEIVTVGILVEAYSDYFRKRFGQKYQVQELDRKLSAMKWLEPAHDVDVSKFGPKLLKSIRQQIVDTGKTSRSYTNRLINEIRRCFRWGVAEELVKPEVVTALESLSPLRHGEGSFESSPRKAVSLENVQAAAKYLPPVVRDMLRVQLATGMRPTEVCIMRPCDIDRNGEVWLYKPSSHKTLYRGQTREVPIVGDARLAVENYLNRRQDCYLFSPKESMAWIRAKQSSERKGYGSYKKLKAEPKKQPGDKYDHSSYRKAIEYACKKAGIANWTPYQVRHLVGCLVGQTLNLEAAKALLGHNHISTTEIYSKASTKQAIDAALKLPGIATEGNN